MKAKTRAENVAEGEVRGSAQMVSCQCPTVCVRVSVCTCLYVCMQYSYHAYLCMLYVCGVYVNPCFLVCNHACVYVCLCPLSGEEVCAHSCSSQMALANRHCEAGRVGTATQCTVGTASYHALPYVPGRGYLLPAT